MLSKALKNKPLTLDSAIIFQQTYSVEKEQKSKKAYKTIFWRIIYITKL